MKPADQWKIAVFLCALVCVAILVGTRRRAAPPRDLVNRLNAVKPGAPTAQTSAAPLAIPTPPPVQQPVAPLPPVVSRPVIWPGDVPATRIIHIPDPQQPSSGAMEQRLRDGDELEFDLAPMWDFHVHWDAPAVEIAIDGGDGFRPIMEYEKHVKQAADAGAGPWWTNSRVARFRVKPGFSGEATLKFVIEKRSADEGKPPPPVEPQKFGILLAGFKRLTATGNNSDYITVDLDLRNTSASDSVAVALYCLNPRVPPFSDSIQTTLTGSDGTDYWCEKDSLSGIRAVNANRQNLTEIGPGETRSISIQFKSAWGLRGKPSRFIMRSELVMDENFRADPDPGNYRPTPGALPAGCKTYNMVFDIPVRYRQSN